MNNAKDIKIPTENRKNNFWFGTMFDKGEMTWLGKNGTGMRIPKNLKRIMTDVAVMNALSDALADAGEPLDTAGNALLRIYNAERRTAVRESIRYELVNRLNKRVASGNPRNELPRPPLSYLENSMRNARRWALKFAEAALND